jgi:ubiquinol-cytochrome c reductase cytochrome b subunit
VGAYLISRRICLGLQRKDAETLEHGVEIGIIRQLPDGGFVEDVRPVTAEERAVLYARPSAEPLPTADRDGIPGPVGRGVIAKLRVGMNAVYTESVAVANGHADGEHHPGDGQGELPAGESSKEAAADPGRSS